MKTKKIITVITTVAMLLSAVSVFSVSANDTTDEVMNVDVQPMPIPTVPVVTPAQQEPEYYFIEGSIKEIKDYIGSDGKPVGGKQTVTIEKGENIWTAIIDENTYYISFGKTSRKAMSTGDAIRVFYNAKDPMIMIYPPQFTAEFIALNIDEAVFITIARFDENFKDPKNQLKLNIPDRFNSEGKTEIVYEDDKIFEGEIKELVNRKLVVLYSVSTRSIPAQTTPEKLIIMYEKAVPPIYHFTDEEKSIISKSLENAAISVNGKIIEAPGIFMDDNGIVMVPVRAVAEALGLKVEWFDDTKGVQVGKSLFCVIDKDQYSYNRMAPITLGAAPVLKNGRTFVPAEFFAMNTIDGLKISYYFGYANANGTGDNLSDSVVYIESEPAD